MTDFAEFFVRLSGGQRPFPYQARLAEAPSWPARIEVPTGLGKTLAVIAAWRWRRRSQSPHRASTPRRLVYCLPMRVLVEQTRDVVERALRSLGEEVRVVVLMGGVEDAGDWDIHPEADAIVIGTQDMLISRALQRGYGMSRHRWPLHFGLLNNDCLWIIDEVQLVGTGVATTAQLQALRRTLGTARPTFTSWMSATLEEAWLRTVDVSDADLAGQITLDDDDRADATVARRIGARKELRRAAAPLGDTKALATEVLKAHRAGTRTLVIVNTVDRAAELHKRLAAGNAPTVLVHSRFRPPERALALEAALAPPGPAGTIVVSTQVIEAGVDVSATTLFTELAPWASLVQRFGRCNRRGEDEGARVFWVGPVDAKARAKLAPPYASDELGVAEAVLRELDEAGPAALPRRPMALARGPVLRRRDILDLFDTTPDLMGDDVDVSRFIRDTDDHDVRVFWRNFDGAPDPDAPSPSRDELCPAPVGLFGKAWSERDRYAWSALRGAWERVERVRPGMTLMLRAAEGGYDPVRGLDAASRAPVSPRPVVVPLREDRAYDGEPESEWRDWYLLSAHSKDVAEVAGALADAVGLAPPLAEALTIAGRWHDAGKAHPVWQEGAKSLGSDPPAALVAKTKRERGALRLSRRGFRHELASALLALQRGQSDLVAFLVACHHGKVRLSLRSVPGERPPLDARGAPDPSIPHARGVWEGDELPEIDLGGVVVPTTRLTLRYMALGDDEETGASWSARVLALRDDPELGPFRLGYLEALIKCADERASIAAQEALR
jgi:CRISPR-associated endonuclease/helicase Cas3